MKYTEDIEIEGDIRNLVGSASGEFYEGYEEYWIDYRRVVEEIKDILERWRAVAKARGDEANDT